MDTMRKIRFDRRKWVYGNRGKTRAGFTDYEQQFFGQKVPFSRGTFYDAWDYDMWQKPSTPHRDEMVTLIVGAGILLWLLTRR